MSILSHVFASSAQAMSYQEPSTGRCPSRDVMRCPEMSSVQSSSFTWYHCLARRWDIPIWSNSELSWTRYVFPPRGEDYQVIHEKHKKKRSFKKKYDNWTWTVAAKRTIIYCHSRVSCKKKGHETGCKNEARVQPTHSIRIWKVFR